MSKVVMKRYDAYKDSGLEWLVEVPEHWKISHLKRFCTKITDGAHTSPDLSSNDYPFLTVVNLNNGILDFENCLFTSYIDYKKLVLNGCQPKKYDVLYSKDGTISETAVIDEDRNFVVGSSFIIVRPNLKMSNSFYLCYFLSSAIMRYQARIYVKGASLPRISIFNIAKLISIIPPLLEQQAIAAYLNTKTAQIDRKVDLLTRKATQYGKLKQSLINETVTRGLDKTVAMKDSGVEWIGEMPEHWGVKRLKDITLVKRGASPRPIDDPIYFDEEGEFSWVRIADLSASERYLLCTKEKLSALGASLSVKRYSGDFILSIAGTVGKPIITKIKCCIHDGFVWFPNLKVNPEFLYYCFSTGLPYQGLGKLGTQLNLNTETVGLISLPIPSDEEIYNIICYLNTKTAHIDNIVTTINTQIDKLKELRKTLINDVLTGKIKVA